MRHRTWSACCAVALVALATPSSGYPRPGATYRVSVSSSGAQGNAHSGSDGAWNDPELAMTPDARFVAFNSLASNLVTGDTNGAEDVFVRDRRTGRTERVSVASDGHEGRLDGLVRFSECAADASADAPAISADGRYVAFHSCFPNLVPLGPLWLGDTNAVDDVFVHDRKTRETIRVSLDENGGQRLFGSWFPTISADGRYVTYESGPAVQHRVYVHDRTTRATKLVPLADSAGSSLPLLGSAQAYQASISPDGRYVSFVNDSGVPLAPHPLYLYDRSRGTLELVSRKLDGGAATAFWGNTARTQVISADNRYVVYEGIAGDAVPNGGDRHGSINPGPQVMVFDRTTKRTERVSVDGAGGGLFYSAVAAISRDGRYVAFQTSDSWFTGVPHTIAVHDRLTGATDWVPISGTCSTSADCLRSATITADGRYVAFSSGDDRLVGGDTNKSWDVFVRDRGGALGVNGLAARTSGTSVALDGADLAGASLVRRPHDLFLRWEVTRMPQVALANPALVYGMEFRAGGARYQVRAGAPATFGLFRQEADRWAPVATLDGGYGTTGQRVVVAVPRGLVGDDVTAVTAFTSLGSVRLDTLSLDAS